jgi:hypothetical protein
MYRYKIYYLEGRCYGDNTTVNRWNSHVKDWVEYSRLPVGCNEAEGFRDNPQVQELTKDLSAHHNGAVIEVQSIVAIPTDTRQK